MTKQYREISIFVGHPYKPKNEVYKLEEFRTSVYALLDRVKDSLNTAFRGFSINTILQVNEFHERLPAQIEKQITNCHFGIFDISDNNPNVLYELGYLSARGVPHAILKSKRSEAEFPVPVDISNRLICFYNQISDIESLLFDTILQTLHRILKDQSLPSGYLSDLWFPADTRYIHVVSSNESIKTNFSHPSSPNYMYLDNLGDKDALLETMVFLSRFYPRARTFIYASDDFPARHIQDNLVVIGGPGEIEGEGNIICRQIMNKIDSKISYTDDCEVLLCEGKEHRASFDKNSYMTRDFGYFARFPNPFNSTSTVILINGIHTYGVLGAMRAFSDHPSAQINIRKILEKSQFKGIGGLAFESFFPVDIVSGEVVCPKIEMDNVLMFE